MRKDEETGTLFLYDYIPKRFWDTCSAHELVETNSILTYKDYMDEKNSDDYSVVIDITFALLDAISIISHNDLRRPKGLYLLSVPRSDPKKESTISHSIKLIAKLSEDGVAKTNSGCTTPLIDASNLIIRTKPQKAQHIGGGRSLDNQLDSMDIAYDGILKNDVGYVIIDDIVTTGTQMKACRMLLQNKKGIMPHNIVQLAIGRTIW